MRYKQWIFIGVLIVFLLTCGRIDLLAADTGFSTTEASSEETVRTFPQNVELSLLESEPSKRTIDCFDVNEEGMVAVGCSKYESRTVCVYTSEGHFQYGYSFKSFGAFEVELNEDILNIYFVLENVAIVVNPLGEVLEVFEIPRTTENETYWKYLYYSTHRKTADAEYTMKNDRKFLQFFATSYSQITVKYADGQESILYDVTAAQMAKVIGNIILFMAVFLLVVIVIVRYSIKLKQHP